LVETGGLKVNIRALEALPGGLEIGGHRTTCHHEQFLGTFPILSDEISQLPAHATLRALPHRTGIENDDVRFVFACSLNVAARLHRVGRAIAVDLVHLTTDSPDPVLLWRLRLGHRSTQLRAG
jgi:hypothetical protein